MPLGRLLGFPVVLSPSWLVLAAALTIGYGRLFHREGPVAYAWGAGLVVSLAGSVLLHELGHALACRRLGIGVRSVTLELLGGYTDMDRDAPRPAVEAAVSLAGPAVSALLGLLAAAVAALTPPDVAGHEVAVQLAATNLVIAVFNTLPGLPLDGGRALLAAVWAWTGDQYRGIRIAGRAGWVVAGGCLAVAVVVAVRGRGSAPGVGHIVAVVALVLVALSVGHGAGQAVRLGRLGARLPLLNVVTMARPVFQVPTGTPLDEARRRVVEAGADGATLGVADAHGAVVALVIEALAAAVPEERRGRVTVDAVARSMAGRVLHPDLRGADVLRALHADPTGDYLVASGEDVVGVLRGVDVARLLTSRESAE